MKYTFGRWKLHMANAFQNNSVKHLSSLFKLDTKNDKMCRYIKYFSDEDLCNVIYIFMLSHIIFLFAWSSYLKDGMFNKTSLAFIPIVIHDKCILANYTKQYWRAKIKWW